MRARSEEGFSSIQRVQVSSSCRGRESPGGADQRKLGERLRGDHRDKGFSQVGGEDMDEIRSMTRRDPCDRLGGRSAMEEGT